MLKILNDYVNIEIQKELTDWFWQDDGLMYSSTDTNITKVVTELHTKKLFNKELIPTNMTSVLNSLVGLDWELDEFLAAYGDNKAQIHADAGNIANKPSFAINLALTQEINNNYTVFFDNYWKGNSAKFVRYGSSYSQSFNTNSQVTDYTNIVNFTDRPFDVSIYDKYLTHIPYDNLHGLTLHSIVKNVPGTILIWDRSMIHCASFSTSKKLLIAVFLNKK